MNKCKCDKCSSDLYKVVDRKTIRDKNYGIIVIELRECKECFYRYRVAIDNDIEFYY